MEFQANSQDEGNQYQPDVDQNGDGSFVVVWNESYGSESIKGRRYDSGGSSSGFVASSGTTYVTYPSAPAVAIDSTGSFVVVWGSGSSYDNRRVIGRSFDSSGVAVGSEFVIAGAGYGRRLVDVTSRGSGEFMVIWFDSGCGECNEEEINGRIVNDEGSAVGSAFMVDPDADYVDAIAIDGRVGGQFVVAWGRDKYYVEAQRLTSDGTRVGAAFQVNTGPTYQGDRPLGVAVAGDDDFVVAWMAYSPVGGDQADVLARVFDSSGAAVGDEFLVNTYTTGDQGAYSGAKIAYDGLRSEFLVVWSSYDQPGDEDFGIRAQRLSSSGALVGAEFQVNTYTPYAQGGSTAGDAGFNVTSGEKGDFVVVWDSEYQDGAQRGVFGQRLGLD